VLGERERRRSRVRTTTDAGTDIGIVVDGDRTLRPGDVLVDDDERLVVVEFERREALVVDVAGVDATTDSLCRLAELGHHVGNRHVGLAVRDGEVLVALGTDGERTVEEVRELLPAGAETRRERVDPTLFDRGGGSDHTHGHGGDHAHGHDADGHAHGGVDYQTMRSGEKDAE